MELKNLLYTVEDGICTITINRPDKLNALNIETIKEIETAICTAQADHAVSGIIITGAGPKAFVAGADIAEFADFSISQAKEMAASGHQVFNHIEKCKKPVIAAVNGFALGGGCELAMACHMRVAATNAKFGQPEVNLGVIPGYGGTQRLVRLIGRTKATELLLTADVIGAEEAKQLGLVNHVVAPEELIAKAKEILNKIAQKSPLAVTHVLELINTYYNKGADGFKEEITQFANCFSSEDFKEGVSAFLEKRKANFERPVSAN
jgi:enoyl-CoA hydratase